jgi:hypothetical protein
MRFRKRSFEMPRAILTYSSTEPLPPSPYKHARPLGFNPYKPRKPEKKKFIADILSVVEEYRAFHPLAIRQVYYRLVAKHGYPKGERLERALYEMATKLRRARVIPMETFRDDGTSMSHPPNTWQSQEDFLEVVRQEAETLNLDRSIGQKSRLVVWCEAAGMVPQLKRVAHDEFGVPVVASGGYDSFYRYDFLKVVAGSDIPYEVLHVGDFDPSGDSIFDRLARDVITFRSDEKFQEEHGSGHVRFTRLAVTEEQVEHYQLPTAETNPEDNRAFSGDWTCQAEALAPDVMNAILRDALAARVDAKALARLLKQERAARRELMVRLG